MAVAPYIPTPEQIELECLAIQAEWSDDERERRWQYPSGGRWYTPGAMKHRSPEDLSRAERGLAPNEVGSEKHYDRDEEPLVYGD